MKSKNRKKFEYFVHVVTTVEEPCLIKKELNVTVQCNSVSPDTEVKSVSLIPSIIPVGCIVLVPQTSGKLHVGVSKFNRKKEAEHGNDFDMKVGYDIAVESSKYQIVVVLPELITIDQTKTIRDRNLVNDLLDVCSKANGVPPKNIKFIETMRSLRYDVMSLNRQITELSKINDLLKSRLETINFEVLKLSRRVSKKASVWKNY